VKYSFDTLDQSWRPYNEIDFRISRNMIDFFAAFVKTGVPQVEGLAKWEPLGKDQPKFMHFGDAECAMEEVPADRLAATEAKGKPFPAM
jgi:para-nitrobenzyl esterase